MSGLSHAGKKEKSRSVYLALAKLWIPVSLFLFFLASILSREELLERFLGNASNVVRQTIEYGSQIGLWLSAAFLVQRMITIFIWDGLISGISGRPIPRLPKDVTGIIVFASGRSGGCCDRFRSIGYRNLGYLWVLSIVVGIALRNVISTYSLVYRCVEQPFRIGDWVMIHQNRLKPTSSAK